MGTVTFPLALFIKLVEDSNLTFNTNKYALFVFKK
jgi:hypothetical protein